MVTNLFRFFTTLQNMSENYETTCFLRKASTPEKINSDSSKNNLFTSGIPVVASSPNLSAYDSNNKERTVPILPNHTVLQTVSNGYLNPKDKYSQINHSNISNSYHGHLSTVGQTNISNSALTLHPSNHQTSNQNNNQLNSNQNLTEILEERKRTKSLTTSTSSNNPERSRINSARNDVNGLKPIINKPRTLSTNSNPNNPSNLPSYSLNITIFENLNNLIPPGQGKRNREVNPNSNNINGNGNLSNDTGFEDSISSISQTLNPNLSVPMNNKLTMLNNLNKLTSVPISDAEFKEVPNEILVKIYKKIRKKMIKIENEMMYRLNNFDKNEIDLETFIEKRLLKMNSRRNSNASNYSDRFSSRNSRRYSEKDVKDIRLGILQKKYDNELTVSSNPYHSTSNSGSLNISSNGNTLNTGSVKNLVPTGVTVSNSNSHSKIHHEHLSSVRSKSPCSSRSSRCSNAGSHIDHQEITPVKLTLSYAATLQNKEKHNSNSTTISDKNSSPNNPKEGGNTTNQFPITTRSSHKSESNDTRAKPEPLNEMTNTTKITNKNQLRIQKTSSIDTASVSINPSGINNNAPNNNSNSNNPHNNTGISRNNLPSNLSCNSPTAIDISLNNTCFNSPTSLNFPSLPSREHKTPSFSHKYNMKKRNSVSVSTFSVVANSCSSAHNSNTNNHPVKDGNLNSSQKEKERNSQIASNNYAFAFTSSNIVNSNVSSNHLNSVNNINTNNTNKISSLFHPKNNNTFKDTNLPNKSKISNQNQQLKPDNNLSESTTTNNYSSNITQNENIKNLSTTASIKRHNCNQVPNDSENLSQISYESGSEDITHQN